MRKVKVVSTTIVAILIIGGMLALSTYAKGKPPKPEPTLDYVLIEGDIWGGGTADTGDPMSIAIAFSGTFQGYDENDIWQNESGPHVANPDKPPALKIRGAGVNRRLTYYYCTASNHGGDEVDELGRCKLSLPEYSEGHDPEYYRQLVINDGRFNRKTGQTVFPQGSSWTIWGKTILPDGSWDGWLVAEGTLVSEVSYEEFYQ